MSSENDAGRDAAEERSPADGAGLGDLFDAMEMVVLVVSPDGRILFANGAVTRKLGYEPEELRHMDLRAVYPENRRSEVCDSLAAVFPGRSSTCSLPMAGKEGNLLPVRLHCSAAKWQGAECIVCIGLDAAELQGEGERYRQLFGSYPSPMALTTIPDLKFSDVNDAFLAFVGYSRDEVIGKTSGELGLYDDPGQREEIRRAIGEKGCLDGCEVKLRRKDGSLRDCLLSCEVFDRNGREQTLSFMTDITERNRTENALRENEELLRTTLNTTVDGILVVDRNGKVSHMNRRFAQMWNIPPDKIRGSSEDADLLASVVHQLEAPDSFLARVRELYQCNLEDLDEVRFKDGRIFERYSSPISIGGEVIGRVWDFHDITERKRKEHELKSWMDRYNLIVAASGQVVYEYDVNAGTITWGESVEKVFGYALEEMQGGFAQWENLLHPKDRSTTLRCLKTAMDACAYWEVQYRLKNKQGHYVWVRDRGFFLPDDSGKARTQLGMIEDVTDRKRAEAALRQSEERYREIFNATSEAILIQNMDTGRILDCNDAMLRMYAFNSKEEALRCTVEHISAGTEEYCLGEALRKIRDAAGGKPQVFEWLSKKHTGETFWVEVALRISTISGHNRVLTVVRDISERKASEKIMRLVQYGVDRARDPVFWLDGQGRAVYVNEAACRSLGYSREELLALPFSSVDPVASPETLASYMNELRERKSITFEAKHRTRDGRSLPVEITSSYVVFEGQEGSFSFARDITERKRAAEELHQSEEKYRNLFDSVDDAILVQRSQASDVSNSFIEANEAACRLLGYSREELLELSPLDIVKRSPDGASPAMEMMHALNRDGTVLAEGVLITKDGYDVPVELHIRRVQHRGQDMVLATARDLTERRRAEQDRERLQAQLFQAQKMESVGRLAGGVAHDFNNMLGAIIGYSELGLTSSSQTSPLHHYLEEILKAAGRSADLTRQLLAFARKQTIAPKILDLNETVEGMLKMLRRLIGENIDLAWLPGAGLWRVKMDPVQVDQILANLCVNAKDAIGEIGRVTIETANAACDESSRPSLCSPGRYVMLAVSDNGCGMDKETQAQIFDPFFTTKGLGKGTGLGLATVYGIVRQNEGFISVYSEPGHGTLFKIYIPAHAEADVESRADEVVSAIPLGGGETILIVEDEPAILEMSETMLVSLGYEVLTAVAPGEAIRLANEYPGEIHMLMTDMVMPGMNGKELAQWLQSARPSMECLFMSGYAAEAIGRGEVLEEGVHFIQKPFSMKALAEKIREVLRSRGA
ncbi:MAG: PAS domain S-box protein [Desulfobacteraceae bacterium]|nr:PAS domain S-box protein [Desulfobacteraceae bacterium]